MWTCKHCKNEFEFKTISEKANHSRWCSENPKRNDWDKTAASEKNYGKVRSFTVACNECGSDFTVKEREKLFPQKEQYFCSRNCANAQGGKAKAEKYGIVGDRTIANKHYKQECAVCGEDRVIDVHHIDEDRLNNHPSNLIFLCPNLFLLLIFYFFSKIY